MNFESMFNPNNMSAIQSATPSKAKFNDTILPDIQSKDYNNELENYEQHVYRRS